MSSRSNRFLVWRVVSLGESIKVDHRLRRGDELWKRCAEQCSFRRDSTLGQEIDGRSANTLRVIELCGLLTRPIHLQHHSSMSEPRKS